MSHVKHKDDNKAAEIKANERAGKKAEEEIKANERAGKKAEEEAKKKLELEEKNKTK
ncbi:hypothetical protein KAR91_47755 [Candidatus Pacearchaeota archaeon]|nr:hypothetical protein [Candidatus Pacearchaeota archaeon]